MAGHNQTVDTVVAFTDARTHVNRQVQVDRKPTLRAFVASVASVASVQIRF